MPSMMDGLFHFKGSHVDDKTVFDIGFRQACISCVDVLDVDHFAVRQDILLGTEVEQFLSLSNPTDWGT